MYDNVSEFTNINTHIKAINICYLENKPTPSCKFIKFANH